jgi:hypothetical protein
LCVAESWMITPPPCNDPVGWLNIAVGAAQVVPESDDLQSLPLLFVRRTVAGSSVSATARGPPFGSFSVPGTRVSGPHVLPASSERL